MCNKQCVVLFPVYQSLSKIEYNFLENGLYKTEGFTQIIIAPESLIVDSSFGNLQHLKVERFSNHYFEGIAGYNKLMLSLEFYNRFKDYEYLLIHQADAYLFKNELEYWCKKQFDYIGAPWYRSSKLNKGFIFDFIYKNLWQPLLVKKRKNGWLYNKVGNGGLSLRKINTAINILEITPRELLNTYINTTSTAYNEDIFWSIEAPGINKGFKIPACFEALQFSVEFEPKIAYKHLNYKLPFGCHAPLLNDKSFWKDFIPAIQSL